MSTYTIFLILIIFVAFLLVIVVMVQNPKGGGLASSFGGGGTQQLGGVKKTTDFLDKSTWTLATLLLASPLPEGGGDCERRTTPLVAPLLPLCGKLCGKLFRAGA